MRYLFCSLAVLFGTTALVAAQGPKSPLVAAPFRTPQEVWAGFDPRREPLDVEVKAAWVEKGIAYREFYFTGETFQKTPVRVYAMYAAPQGGKGLPAILHMHGGGGTVSRLWLDLWTSRGYAALSFNWGGRWEKRADYTRWGPLVQGNHLDANPGVVAVRPDQHVSCWYHWAVVSRRCLTYLERQPEVDPQRIGIFGISMGGTLAWPVAAMDQRVKAACAIYGNGGHLPPRPQRGRSAGRRRGHPALAQDDGGRVLRPADPLPLLVSQRNQRPAWKDGSQRQHPDAGLRADLAGQHAQPAAPRCPRAGQGLAAFHGRHAQGRAGLAERTRPCAWP